MNAAMHADQCTAWPCILADKQSAALDLSIGPNSHPYRVQLLCSKSLAHNTVRAILSVATLGMVT